MISVNVLKPRLSYKVAPLRSASAFVGPTVNCLKHVEVSGLAIYEMHSLCWLILNLRVSV